MGVPVWPDCDIFKGLGDNVLVIIAQIFVNLLGYIEKCHLLSKTAVTTFGQKMGYFYIPKSGHTARRDVWIN